MTETQWLTDERPVRMFRWLTANRPMSGRKLRLYQEGVRSLCPITADWVRRMFDASSDIQPAVAAVLRDIVGNPFVFTGRGQPWLGVAATAALNPHITGIAQSAYDERIDGGAVAADRLLVLSDALEEAGCDNEDILVHLRSPGTHVQGCWVLDLLLGKA